MLFFLVRVAIALVIGSILILGIKRAKIVRKRLCFVLYILFLTIISIIPFENLFMSFESPEAVFRYSRLGRIHDVVYGNDSAMIFYTTRRGFNVHDIVMFVPKTDGGYKIPTFRTVSRDNRQSMGLIYTVYSISNTTDYYISGAIWVGETVYVVDSKTENIITYATMWESDSNIIRFHAFIENWSDSYEVVVRLPDEEYED